MTWSEEAAKFDKKPVIILELELDSGTVRYSNREVEVPGEGFYEGRVLTFGTISRSVNNTDGQFQISDVTTTLSNADGLFSSTDLETLMNRSATYRIGFEGQDIADYKVVFAGKIANFKFKNYTLDLVVTDATKLWLEKAYGHTLDSADWPNAHSGVGNMKMPIIYGELTGNI